MVQKIDFAKYAIIYHFGGVYIDMDMECIKDITDLIDEDDELIFSYMDNMFNPLSCGVFLSSPKNKFWKDLIDDIEKNKKGKWHYINEAQLIVNTTGCGRLRKNVKEYTGKIKILDHKYLEPCSTKFVCDSTPDMRLKDNLGNHWLGTPTTVLIYMYSYKYYFIFIILLLILIVYLIYKKKTNVILY